MTRVLWVKGCGWSVTYEVFSRGLDLLYSVVINPDETENQQITKVVVAGEPGADNKIHQWFREPAEGPGLQVGDLIRWSL